MSDYISYDNYGGKTPALAIWKDVLFSPSVDTFSRYLPEADLGRAVVWLLLSGLITVILGLISIPLSQAQLLTQYPEVAEMLEELPIRTPVAAFLCGLPTGVVMLLLGVFISVGLTYLAARLLQGTGTFTETFFLYVVVMAPVSVLTGSLQFISSLVGLIPVLGVIFALLFALVSFAFAIYTFVLYSMSVAAAHRFSIGKGFAAIILPGLVIGLLVCCLTAISLIAFAPVIEEVMREISYLLPVSSIHYL